MKVNLQRLVTTMIVSWVYWDYENHYGSFLQCPRLVQNEGWELNHAVQVAFARTWSEYQGEG